MKDIFGNTLAPGTFFAYTTSSNSHVNMRLGKVLADGSCRVVSYGDGRNEDGSYSRAWRVMKGRPGATVVILDPLFIGWQAFAVLDA